MTSISEKLYPNCYDEEYFYAPSEYEPIIHHLGNAIWIYSERGYQGDTYVLYKNYNIGKLQWGFLNIGWGSCSGCDALQGCNSYEDITQLIERLSNSIRWFNDPNELITFLTTDDIPDYYKFKQSWMEFSAIAVQIINLKFTDYGGKYIALDFWENNPVKNLTKWIDVLDNSEE